LLAAPTPGFRLIFQNLPKLASQNLAGKRNWWGQGLSKPTRNCAGDWDAVLPRNPHFPLDTHLFRSRIRQKWDKVVSSGKRPWEKLVRNGFIAQLLCNLTAAARGPLILTSVVRVEVKAERMFRGTHLTDWTTRRLRCRGIQARDRRELQRAILHHSWDGRSAKCIHASVEEIERSWRRCGNAQDEAEISGAHQLLRQVVDFDGRAGC